MSNYNVTASRFSLPNSGRANSGDSKVRVIAMSVFVVSNNVNDSTELVCESCADSWLVARTGVAPGYALPVLGTLSVEFVGLEWTFARASEFNPGDTCPWCLGTLTPSTLTISIGRGVPKARVSDVPGLVQNDIERDTHELVERAWLAFQNDIEEFRGGRADTRALGESSYLGESEETCVFQFFNTHPLTPSEITWLSYTRERYGQDSIAVSYSAPDFI